jgi:hypothetical protein
MASPSSDLIEQYKTIHSQSQYGRSAKTHRAAIQACIVELQPQSILEYGCGRSRLCDDLDYDTASFTRFDPAIPGIDVLNASEAEFVINTDVLEHIPESELDDLLARIAALGDKVFFNICTRLASEVLPNGENAHCTVLPAEEWLEIVLRHFPQAELVHVNPKESCLILTWDSRVASIIYDLEELKMQARHYKMKSRSALRKLEKQIRILKDKLLNPAKHHRP